MKHEGPTSSAEPAAIASEIGDGQAQSPAEPDPLAPESLVSKGDPRLPHAGVKATQGAIADQSSVGPRTASTYFVHFH